MLAVKDLLLNLLAKLLGLLHQLEFFRCVVTIILNIYWRDLRRYGGIKKIFSWLTCWLRRAEITEVCQTLASVVINWSWVHKVRKVLLLSLHGRWLLLLLLHHDWRGHCWRCCGHGRRREYILLWWCLHRWCLDLWLSRSSRCSFRHLSSFIKSSLGVSSARPDGETVLFLFTFSSRWLIRQGTAISLRIIKVKCGRLVSLKVWNC